MAGLRAVPVLVRENVSGRDALELALIENVQRQDLNPIEEAQAYHQLHQEFGLTQEEIARRVGKERATVANLLRLLRLPEAVKRLVAGGELTMGHARALLAVENRSKIEQLAQIVVRRGLNVRQTELLASGAAGGRKARPEKRKDVFTRDAEEKLTRQFRTKIEIDRRKRGGIIRMHFSSEEELIRLFEQMTVHGRKR
jgi:ParB family chromosome partitioning protein